MSLPSCSPSEKRECRQALSDPLNECNAACTVLRRRRWGIVRDKIEWGTRSLARFLCCCDHIATFTPAIAPVPRTRPASPLAARPSL
ncbi:hypothetical protein MRB53_039384 [Persea americana]|nr:hypothetical protein MRB53_039384 [Persea americana]